MSDFNKDEYLNDLPDMDDLSGQAAPAAASAADGASADSAAAPLAQRRKVQLSRLPRNRKKMAIPLPLTVLTRQTLPTARPTIR
jgi:hypothetical protein